MYRMETLLDKRGGNYWITSEHTSTCFDWNERNKRSIQNERRHEKEDKIFEIRIEIRKVNILTGESNGLCREEILHFCSRNVISET